MWMTLATGCVWGCRPRCAFPWRGAILLHVAPMAENAAALIGSGLHKRFLVKKTGQTIHAVADVSLEIPVGTLTALVGPDGAGKTTLLRMMAGLMVPDEGRLEVLGIDVDAD